VIKDTVLVNLVTEDAARQSIIGKELMTITTQEVLVSHLHSVVQLHTQCRRKPITGDQGKFDR